MNKYEVKIDYLSATFPMVLNDNDSKMFKVNEIVTMVASFMHIQSDEVKKDKYAHNYFNYEFTLSSDIKLRLDGPINRDYQKTCQIEMKGEGCRKFEELNPDLSWKDLILFLLSLNASFKRIDIAIDDFNNGVVNLPWLYKKLKNKHYTSVFRGSFYPYGDVEEGLMTIQLGSKNSSTQLVIYDKKKEREDRNILCDKLYWVRFEMRFRQGMAQDMVNVFLQAKDIETFALGHLYWILDIKEDNNYSVRHQNNVTTDKDWLLFLNNVNKKQLIKTDSIKVPTWSSYEKYALPYVSSLLIFLWIICKHDDRRFTVCIYALLARDSNFSKPRLKRLNQYLKELHIDEVINENELEELRKAFYSHSKELIYDGDDVLELIDNFKIK